MIISSEKSEKKSWWILGIIFASQFLSQKINLVLIIWCFLYFLALGGLKLQCSFPGRMVYFYLFLCGLLAGILNLNDLNHSIYSYFKHLYYFILVFLYWIIGCQIVRYKRITHKTIIVTLTFASVAYSMYDLVSAAIKLSSGEAASLYQYRNMIGNGSFLSMIGIYLLLFYRRELSYGRRKFICSFLICLFSFLIHFSRTLFIELFILLIFSGIKVNLSKLSRLLLILLAALLAVYIISPDMTLNFVNKIYRSALEINFRNDEWTQTTITQNWRGYEVYCELLRFKDSGFLEKLFGGGFGTTLDVLGYAYLVTQENTLPFLHNGYYTQLMIWGVLGVVGFFIWGVQVYKCGSSLRHQQDRHLVKGMAVIILVITYFIMGPFFSMNVAVYLFYIALFYMVSVVNKASETHDEGNGDSLYRNACKESSNVINTGRIP